jgi:hypothetical protein
VSSAGVELYDLIQRLLGLQASMTAHEARIREARRELEARYEQERRRAEELVTKLREEFVVALKQLREKLGIPEPDRTQSMPFEIPNFDTLFKDLFAQFGMKTSEPPL